MMRDKLRPPQVVSDAAKKRALLDAGARLGEVFPGYLILCHDAEGYAWRRGRDRISMRGLLEQELDRQKTEDRVWHESGDSHEDI